MKTLILILSLFVFTVGSSAQEYATLRIGNTDASTLSPGDAVFVPFIADDISNIVMGFGFKMSFDSAVITWNGTSVYPAPGVSYIHPNLNPLGGDWLFNNNEGNNILFSWIDPTFNGAEINPGDTIIVLHFTYWGGETELKWEYPEMYDQNFENFNLTLIDGCVCYLTYYDVTFHVTSNGNDLEGAWVTVGPLTLPTDASGIAVFSLPDGEYSYTVTKDGFVDVDSTFIVEGAPLLIEVEMEVCWDVTIHVVSGGVGLTGCTITIGDLVFNNDTTSTVCLPEGVYPLTVTKEGYYPYNGSITVDGSPQTKNIILYPMSYPVTFFVNCCGEPLEGIMLTIGTTTVVTGPDGLAAFNLTEGDYTFEINGYIFTFSVPETTYIDADICSEVTFHVGDEQGNSLAGATVTVNDDIIFTNVNGEAFICLQVGTYDFSISKLGYVTLTGSFEMDTIPQTVEMVMPLETWGVTINVIGFECDNEFEELIIICNGDTVSVGQPIYLENGSYNFAVAIEGCPSLVTGSIEVLSAPQTIEVSIEDFPKAYVLISSIGGSIPGVEVIMDSEDTLYTSYNSIGFYCAEFCVSGGDHSVHIPEYGFWGDFTFNCTNDIVLMLEVGTNELNFQNVSFNIYPNPSSGKFYLETQNTGTDPIELQVMDLTGRIVYARKQMVPETIEIDLSGQQNGMYFLRIKTEEENYTQKLIIQ